MWQRGLIVVAEVAALALGTAVLTSCQGEGGSSQQQEAKPASALMRGMNEDRPPDWRDEPEPPQYESPPPEQFQ